MVETILPVQPVTRTRDLGVISSGAKAILALDDDADLRFLSPATSISVTSPRKSDGTHANLTIKVNSDDSKTYSLLGGGGVRTIPGPVHSVEVVPDAAVAGTGTDRVRVELNGVDRIGAQ